ncbi:MAG: hypothetical protein ABL864_13990 [Terricaulis sp.]
MADLIKALESGTPLTRPQSAQLLRWLRWASNFYPVAAVLRISARQLDDDDPAVLAGNADLTAAG